LQFGNAAGSFGNVGSTVEVFGQPLLDRITLLEIAVILVTRIPVRVYPGFHGDDGSGAAESVFVFDGHARPFDDVPHGGATRPVSFSVPAARTWGTYESGFHGKRVVGGEFFVGVEFGRERLEISG